MANRRLRKAIVEMALDLYKYGVIDAKTLRRFKSLLERR
jgi:hypothetical protein